jgi:arylsulfatase A-like enzyme
MNLTRRQFLAASGVAVAIAALPAAAAETPQKNVVFILGDDHRADLLGCAGHPFLKTPNLDRLASEGVRFSNTCVTSAICCASRAGILTGMHPARHRVIDFATAIRDEDWKVSYPQLFRSAGYRTGFFGKFGVNGDTAPAAAFDVVMAPAYDAYYFPKDNPNARHADDLHCEAAEKFIQAQAAAKQPFCVSLSFRSPHAVDYADKPYQPAPEFQSLYNDVTVPHPQNNGAPGFEILPEFLRDSEGRRRYEHNFGGDARYQESTKNYFRMLTGIDSYIGRLRETLKSAGVADNTLLIYMGDNGYFLGERGLEGKWYAYEQSIRVPVIVFDPQSSPESRGKVDARLANECDISATLLDFAGISIPERIQGQSLRKPLTGSPDTWRKDYLYHHHFKHPRIPRSEGVVSPEWKYIRWLDGAPGYEELYDLRKDPWETVNLAFDPKHAETRETMRSRHYALLSKMA